jgi:hypothetical protein
MMRHSTFNIYAILLTGTLLLMMSCTPGSCFEETTAFVKATMCLDSTGKAMTPDSLTLYGINMENKKIYDKNPGVTPVLIPLDASTESCGFVIRINGISDTIWFTYSSRPHIISKECGYTFYHTIDTPVFTRNNINRIFFVTNAVTTLNEENIRIYY